jgi:hypothetical protein
MPEQQENHWAEKRSRWNENYMAEISSLGD